MSEHASQCYQPCDALGDGREVAVTWRGRTLKDVAARRLRLAARLSGQGTRLYGFRLVGPDGKNA